MKKRIGLVFCLVGMLLLAAGCGAKEETEQVNEEVLSGETTEEGEEESLSVAEAVELGEYKGLTYTPVSAEVTDEQVEEQLTLFAESNASAEEVDRPAKEGDTVNIDYKGMKDGVAFEGGTGEGFDLTLGSHTFIDGFEEGLIGAVKGETRNLNLTFPEQYFSEELAGQEVVFEVTVNAVLENLVPSLTDELVQENTEYAGVDDFRSAVRDYMEENARREAEYRKQYELLTQAVENAQVTVPESKVDSYFIEMLTSYEEEASLYGIDLETLASFYGMDLEGFQEFVRSYARDQAEQSLVVQAIAAAEGLTVEEEDMDALLEALGYGSLDELIAMVGEELSDEYLLMEKVVEFLEEYAVPLLQEEETPPSDDGAGIGGGGGGGIYMGSEGDKKPVVETDEDLVAVIEEGKEKFKQEVFADDALGISLEYSLYVPEGYDETVSYPMVMYIPDASGASKSAKELVEQYYGANVWVSSEVQDKHEAFVLVPAFSVIVVDDDWNTSDEIEACVHLIESLKETYSIDASRLYTTGQSMGCMTSLYLNGKYPDLFAASLFVSGQWDIGQLSPLSDASFFYIAAGGDEKASGGQDDVMAMLDAQGVSYSFAGWSAKEETEVQEENALALIAEGNQANFIRFETGSVLEEGERSEHNASFVYGYRIAAVRDWLFDQVGTKESE